MGTLTAVLAFALLLPVTASALGPGAPPVITRARVYVHTSAPNPPRLRAQVDLEIPGGNVPINVQTVTVAVPGGGTYTIPLDQTDLYPEVAYNLNLTSAGVIGFPVGTYIFTATDTAGGVSTVTDSLGATTGLLAPTSVSVSGLVSVPAANGVVSLLNLITTPTPTISWSPVSGAAVYNVRFTQGYADLYIFSQYTSTTSLTLPAGIMVPGRRYFVQADAYDHVNGAGCSPTPCTHMDANARSYLRIEVVTQGPEILLTFGQGPYTAGQTLDVTTRIYNTGPSVTVNANAWIGLPTGAVIPILSMPDLTIPNSIANPTGPNDFYSGPIGFSYTFTGAEPSGVYVVGLRLTDPATGETVALVTRTFAK